MAIKIDYSGTTADENLNRLRGAKQTGFKNVSV